MWRVLEVLPGFQQVLAGLSELGISQQILADLCGSRQVTGVLMGLSGSWVLSLGLGRF